MSMAAPPAPHPTSITSAPASSAADHAVEARQDGGHEVGPVPRLEAAGDPLGAARAERVVVEADAGAEHLGQGVERADRLGEVVERAHPEGGVVGDGQHGDRLGGQGDSRSSASTATRRAAPWL